MNARSELLAIQRNSTAELEREIEQDLVRERPAIRRYHDAWTQEFSGPFATSSRDELAERAAAADLVYVGDYHTLEAAQRTFAWLLEAVHARRGAVSIALEMLEPLDQPAVDAYLAGILPEEKFLEQIRYEERWGFSWEHYQPIFELARRTGSPVYGIDKRPGSRRTTLAVRDRFAASVIARIAQARPGVPVLVLAGDLHLARGHLPARVDSRLKKSGVPRRRVVVFQSPEVLYWKLAARGREHTDVVRLDSERFCIMVATPLAKVRSYFDWARDSSEDDERAAEVLTLLASFFGVPLPSEPALGPPPPGDAILDAIGTADGLAPRTPLDRAAEAAARALRESLAGTIDSTDAYAVALDEALAFFGSLVVNHARAHRTEADYGRFLERHRGRRLLGARARARSVARLVLRHTDAEARWLAGRGAAPRLPRLSRGIVRQAAARALGQRLGALLYRGLIESRVSKVRLRQLLLDPGTARLAYFQLARELRRVGERLNRAVARCARSLLKASRSLARPLRGLRSGAQLSRAVAARRTA